MSSVVAISPSNGALTTSVLDRFSVQRHSRPHSDRSRRSNLTSDTQSSLIRRVRSTNDGESWNDFVLKYRPMLVNVARAQGLSYEDAEDVVQEILMALVRKMPSFQFDPSIGRFRTWLWRIAHNAVIDHVRKSKRAARLEQALKEEGLAAAQTSESESSESLSKPQKSDTLSIALDQIRKHSNERTWACFEQHVLKGRTSAAVAAELEISTNAVFVNSSRVLKKVREACAQLIVRGATNAC